MLLFPQLMRHQSQLMRHQSQLMRHQSQLMRHLPHMTGAFAPARQLG